jgi:hypothetical protein
MRSISVFCFLGAVCVLPVWAGEPLLPLTCTDSDGDGYFAETGCGTAVDCNDAAPFTHPGAPEVCDGYDNDCDLLLDNSPSCQRLCESPEPAVAAPAFGNVDDNDYAHPRMAWAGNQYAFTCHDDLHGTIFQLLDVQGLPLGPTLQLGDGREPSIVWTGEQYGVAFSQTFLRLDRSGNVIAPATPLAPTSEVPSVVWNGSEFAIVSVGCGGLCFSRVTSDGQMIATASLWSGPTGGPPSLAWNGSEYALVWWTPEGLLFGRVDRAGVPIAGTVGIAPDGRYFQILWTGVDYAVMWTYGGDVLFRRLTANGSPTTGVTAVAHGPEARLAWSGQEFALVWWGDGDTLTFARLDVNGNRVGTLVPFGFGDYTPSADVVWNGTDYRVAYFEYGSENPHFYRTQRIGCNCANVDADHDGYSQCSDCNDLDASVYPGALQLCDGKNNNCSEPNWPAMPDVERDTDSDRVINCADLCPDTPQGVMVDAHGCSINQLVPCAGPLSGGAWKNHGQYVSQIAKTAEEFLAEGLITEEQKNAFVDAAASSKCGTKAQPRHGAPRGLTLYQP